LQKRASNNIWQYFGKYFAGVQAGCGPGADDQALWTISARPRFFIDFCQPTGAECARQFQAPIGRLPVINSKLSLWQGFWFGPDQAMVFAVGKNLQQHWEAGWRTLKYFASQEHLRIEAGFWLEAH